MHALAELLARRRTILASGCVLTAAVLIASAPASNAASFKPAPRHRAAAASPAPGWHSYNPGTGSGSVLALYAPSVSSAFAVGQDASGDSAYLKFNGSSWQGMNGPNIGPADSIDGTSGKDLWVLGASESAHYNGTSWTTYPLAVPAGLVGGGEIIGTASSQVYAASGSSAYASVDMVDNATGSVRQILERFTGGKWSVVTNAPNISVDGSQVGEVTGSGPDDVYVTASYNNGQNPEVVHFNGTAWSVVKLPGSPLGVSIAVTGAGAAVAIGYDQAGDTYAARLSFGTWSLISLPAGLLPLESDLSSSGVVWLQMQTSSGSDGPITLWKYTGSAWTKITPNDTEDSGLYGVANGGGVWSFNAGGSFGGGVPASTELYAK